MHKFSIAAWAKRKGVRRKRVVLPPIRSRPATEAQLKRIILSILREMRRHKPELLRAAEQARAQLHQDGLGLDIVLSLLRGMAGPLVDAARALLTRMFGLESARHSKTWIEQVNNAIGIDLEAIVTSDDVAQPIELATMACVALVKGLTEEVAKRVEVTLVQMITQGRSTRDMAKELDRVFAFGEKRAALIARDQAAKFNASLNAIRQKQAGVTKYTWWTVLDERVRGNPDGKYPNAKPSHWNRHGLVFSYDNPPEGGHPGTEINCRCIARPVLEL